MDNLIKNLEFERRLLIDTLNLRANTSDWIRCMDTCASLLVVDAKLAIYKRLYTPPPAAQGQTIREVLDKKKAEKAAEATDNGKPFVPEAPLPAAEEEKPAE